MCVKTSNLIFYLVIYNLNIRATAVKLYPCASSGVIENSTVTFHCDQYSGRVEWRYRGPQSDVPFPISTCNETHCTASFVPRFTTAYISAGNSSLTTTMTSRNVRVAGGEYRCDNNTCRMHILVPASVSTPTSFITRTDQGFSLHCQTRITKVYSSKGQYSCEWQNGTTRVNGTLNLQPPPQDTNNTSDRVGTCSVTLQLSNPSDAMCNVTVSPGNTVASIGIVRPSQPEINCQTCPVPENGTLTCTCTTDNLGQPRGRLVWYAGINGVFDKEIVRGNFEVNTLAMTWSVTQIDHNVTMFGCVNEWIENVNISTDFTAILKQNAPSSSARRRRKRSSDTTSSECYAAATPDERPPIVTILGGSFGGAAVVGSIVVIVIKRKRKGAAKERSQAQCFKPYVQHNAGRSDVSIIAMTAGDTTSTYQGLVVAEVGVPSNYEQLSRYGNVPSSQPESMDNPSFGAYESLQSADVGQTSVYSQIAAAPTNTTHGPDPVYGNSATPKK